ncbi:hypothetical protein DYB31_010904 [Aphanomyces astaci]|uniref:Uncharacterized protein n=1 Tax=Aphanomyces astaci TaxID=112090 RepID=A0A397F4M0_APHAT|nr:hypothetical protein DYB31_010904 [Aphanomyces astaci]
MWSALFGSDETPRPEGDDDQQDKVYGAGEEPDAMQMLLGRLTNLMERLGEAEYSKKQWEKQARSLQVSNEQLKYELEYSSDAQLRERIDDLTAMNEALKEVKVTLEKDAEAKDTLLRTHEDDIARLTDALHEGSLEKENMDHKLEQLKVSSAEDLERLSLSLERQAAHVARLESECELHAQGRQQDAQTFHSIEEDLRGTITSLQAEAARRDIEVKATTDRLYAMEQHFQGELDRQKQVEDTLRAACASYEGQVDAEKAKAASIELKLEQFQAELVTKAAVEAQSQWKEDALRSLTHQVKAVQKELSDALQLNLELTNHVDTIERAKRTFMADLERDRVAAEVATKALKHQLVVVEADLAAQKLSAEAALASERAEVETKSHEIANLRQSIYGFEQVIATATSNEDALRVELETMHGRMTLLTAEVQAVDRDWTAKYDALLEEWRVAKQVAADQEEANKVLADQVDVLKRAVDDAQINAAAEVQVGQLQAEIAQLQAEISLEREQFHARAEASRVDVEQLRQSATALQGNVATWEQAAADATAQVELLRHENENLTNLHANAERALSTLEMERQSWVSTAQASAEEIEKLAQRLSQSQAEEGHVASLEGRITDLEGSIAELNTRHAADLGRLDEQRKAEVEALRQQVANSQEFATECEATGLEWEEKADALLAELASAQEQLRTVEVAADQGNQMLANELEAAKVAKDEALAQLEGERRRGEDLDLQMAQKQSDLNLVTQNLNETKGHLDMVKAELQQAKQGVAEAARHAADARRVLEKEWKDDLERALAQRQELDAALTASQDRISQLERSVHHEHATAAQWAAEKQALEASLACERSASVELKAAHDSLVQEIMTATRHVKDKDAQVEALTLQLAARTDEFKQTTEQLRRDVAQSQAMVGNVHASAEMASQNLEDHIRELQEQMHAHNNKFEAETEDLLEEISSLNGQISELQVQNNVLSARAHRLARDLAQYVKLPADDMALVLNPNTPNLWELLANGMEQLKSDLEVASTYAANLDQMGDEHGDIYIDHPATSSSSSPVPHDGVVAPWIQ